MKTHRSCEIEDFIETQILQAVCDTYSDRAYYWVCVLVKDVGPRFPLVPSLSMCTAAAQQNITADTGATVDR